MAEKLDPRQVVTFEELLRAMMMEQDATRRVLVRKGLLTNEEVLEEIKAMQKVFGKRSLGTGENRRVHWKSENRDMLISILNRWPVHRNPGRARPQAGPERRSASCFRSIWRS